jgi:prepilin-type N-terminal cleavage/methylation domain-containing protein
MWRLDPMNEHSAVGSLPSPTLAPATDPRRHSRVPNIANESAGFTLIELMVATALLLLVSAAVTSALVQMSSSQATIWNRTEMHSGVRGATELLQQEVGQAGRITLPGTVTLTGSVTGVSPCVTPVTVSVSSTSGMFPNENLTLLDGDYQESVALTAVPSSTQITACFTQSHSSGVVLMPFGGFATGIIPPSGISNPSTGSVLKLYGDINGNGNMVYVEYTCDLTSGNLYRNVMAFDAATKPAVTNAQILLSNIVANPGGTSCFTYQTSTVVVSSVSFTFVLDVAITLTVQTQQIDPITKVYQTETKALLNVSPRNVFDAWAYAGMGYSDHIQSTPASVINLLG